MKSFKFYSMALAAMMAGAAFTACSDDGYKPIQGVEQLSDVHYDVWVSLDGTTGMGSGSEASSIIVLGVESLEDSTKTIDFKGVGADVTAVMDAETIVKGKYYYQAHPLGAERKFAKYQITNAGVKTIAEHRFDKNTYNDRRYTHAWLNDSTFVVMAANGKADAIMWTKIVDQGNKLRIAAEGTLDLSATGISKFSTSGLLRYREADNTLVYIFQNKSVTTSFFAAFIDANTMDVKATDEEARMGADVCSQYIPAGTAYGELLQNKMFQDEKGNIYVAANCTYLNAKSSTCQYGRLVRINAGDNCFDKTYMGYNKADGKIVTVDYLGYNKALLYIQDPKHCGLTNDNTQYKKGENWGDAYNCYYAVLDMTTDEVSELTYNGKVLPYSIGTFSQRSFVLNNKAYIGINPQHSAPVIFVYDIKSQQISRGCTINEGYEFNRIVYIEGK